VPLITLSNGKQFTANANESVLEAALRQQIAVGYSCRTGRCSACRTGVVFGSTKALHEELGLTTQEREAGLILSCVRSATSDLLLTIQDLGDLKLAPPRTVPCRVQFLERMAPDVLKVMLRLPPQAAFEYLPGQYIDVIGHGGLRRSYSIANAPAIHQQLELHIRRVPGGAMSAYWFEHAQANDLLRLHGPLGTFVLGDLRNRELIFLATGTGIAPVKAMLESLNNVPADQRPASVTVYWGGRTSADLYTSPLANASSLHARLVPVLSRAAEDWVGARGHVQLALLQDRSDFSNALVFSCGSDTMIHSAREQLLAQGLPPHHFYSDAFVCSGNA
jgi:CDP-4-dehydro-6-deoxyglucose reductase